MASSLKLNGYNRVQDFLVYVGHSPWSGEQDWLEVVNPANSLYGQRPLYLAADGSWVQLAWGGIKPLFKTVEQVEEALALGALCDWNGTTPNRDRD